jgi:hypothetical protein
MPEPRHARAEVCFEVDGARVRGVPAADDSALRDLISAARRMYFRQHVDPAVREVLAAAVGDDGVDVLLEQLDFRGYTIAPMLRTESELAEKIEELLYRSGSRMPLAATSRLLNGPLRALIAAASADG